MLLRISLIVAIIAGLAAGGFGFYEATTQIPALSKQRDDEKSAKETEITAHNKTKTELKKTKADLAQTQQDLSDTKNDLQKAVVRADAQERKAAELSDKLATVTHERDDAQNQLAAYKASNLTPDEVIVLNKKLNDANKQIIAITDEKEILNGKLKATQAHLDRFIGTNTFVTLPADLKGKIVIVDPKWDFVVLNVGSKKGAAEEGELLVSRDGKLVAKVIIRSVENDRCIANIIPGWKLGEPIEGDVVTPAHPAS